jgi:hypothetical protein
MIEHSVVRREPEHAGANHHALAANGWRLRVRPYLARQSPITLMLGGMAEICE